MHTDEDGLQPLFPGHSAFYILPSAFPLGWLCWRFVGALWWLWGGLRCRRVHYRKGQTLQWVLTHSRSARLLAVHRVTTNRGAKTGLARTLALPTPKP